MQLTSSRVAGLGHAKRSWLQSTYLISTLRQTPDVTAVVESPLPSSDAPAT